MRRRTGWIWGLVGVLFVLAGTAYGYRYFDREELARRLPELVGERVKVVDELVRIYQYQEVDGYLKFDTVYFRCFIPESERAGIEYLKELYAGIDDPRLPPPLVTITGKVDRPEFWGEVHGSSAGVDTELEVIVVDSVTRPRARYFREWAERD